MGDCETLLDTEFDRTLSGRCNFFNPFVERGEVGLLACVGNGEICEDVLYASGDSGKMEPVGVDVSPGSERADSVSDAPRVGGATAGEEGPEACTGEED